MSDTAPRRHTYEWACPHCQGNNMIASDDRRTDVKCGWCGHVVDARQCRVIEKDC